MIRAVLDTNTIVSRTIVIHGIPYRILRAARAQRFTLVTSQAIINEVLRVLSRDRVRRKYGLTAADIELVRHFLENDAVLTTLMTEVHGVATHPEDDLILATAASGGADYLVTGDRQLQNLGTYQGITILSPRAFLEVLQAPGSPANRE